MDLVTILTAFGISLVCVLFLAGESTERALDAFGAGFLPYRGPGWPHGVQEGEPVHFDIAAMAERGVPPIDREVAPDIGAEVFEIDAREVAHTELTGVDGGSVAPGRSLRG